MCEKTDTIKWIYFEVFFLIINKKNYENTFLELSAIKFL